MSVEENPNPVVADELTYYLPRGWIRQTVMAIVRTAIIVAVIIAAAGATVTLLEGSAALWLVDLLLFIVWLVIFVVYLRWQLMRISRVGFPIIRGAETIVVGLAIVIAAFARTYLFISDTTPDAFSEPLTLFSSYYFTITTLATVGFGDITANPTSARAVVMVQMLMGLALIAGVVRLVLLALRINARRRAHSN